MSMQEASDRVVETLRNFKEADRRLGRSGRSGPEREEMAREYIRTRRDHQAAIEAVEAEMDEEGR